VSSAFIEKRASYNAKMKTPTIVVNFNTYKEATGKAALSLAEICEDVAREKGVEIAACPQLADCQKIREAVDIPVFAQHADPITPGSHTGWVLIDSLKDIGLDGSLVNHSEHRSDPETVKKTIDMLRDFKLESILCTKDVQETGEYSLFKPDFLAIEPPELIGSGISVSTAQPEVITGAVAAAKNGVPVLCGAGIAKGIDIKTALGLGSKGVLLASGVTKAQDPKKVLMELASYALV
jgi:triosephosphate isomerase (TIM)